jgi:hypothetical protein
MPGTEQNPHVGGTEGPFGLKEQLAAAIHQLKATQQLLSESMDLGQQSLDLAQLQKEQLEAALKEVAHWKSNHACEVSRAKLLKQRPDMPLERISAYDQVGALHARLETIRDAMAQAEQKETIMVGASVWQRMRNAADLNSEHEVHL